MVLCFIFTYTKLHPSQEILPKKLSGQDVLTKQTKTGKNNNKTMAQSNIYKVPLTDSLMH